MSESSIGPELAVLIERWRERAHRLESAAASYRKAGDPEYAQELEAAAIDNLRAAERLEFGASA